MATALAQGEHAVPWLCADWATLNCTKRLYLSCLQVVMHLCPSIQKPPPPCPKLRHSCSPHRMTSLRNLPWQPATTTMGLRLAFPPRVHSKYLVFVPINYMVIHLSGPGLSNMVAANGLWYPLSTCNVARTNWECFKCKIPHFKGTA